MRSINMNLEKVPLIPLLYSNCFLSLSLSFWLLNCWHGYSYYCCCCWHPFLLFSTFCWAM